MERSKEIVVQFDSVSFAYGNVPVLENVSFHIHRGEFAALVGPNGSGKTTVIKLILGLEAPAAGQIELFGSAKGASTRAASTRGAGNNAAWRDKLGYVPQHHPADKSFPISVRDVVRMGLLRPSQGYSTAGKAAVDNAMEQADISDLAARQWRALSGGQQRRTLVARALASQPELLVLDEPTANMDAESEERFFETLGKLKGKATILIVTHDMNFVSILTDRVLCRGDNEHYHGVVQHRTESDNAMQMRVLHGENIPTNDCCENF
jgi:zinc transport system ATP-binding protein